jgi:hypothetical protein
MNFRNITVEKDIISIFASGNSLLDLSKEEYEIIKQKTFVVTTNYAPIRFVGNINCWSDKNASIFLEEHYKTMPKDCAFLSREAAFYPQMEFRKQVDHWFDNRREGLEGNFTAGWALQIFKKAFPDKKILLFGFDFYSEIPEADKWYDTYTDFDREKRGRRFNINDKNRMFRRQMESFRIDRENIFNCNLKSALRGYQKKDWRELLPVSVVQISQTPLAGAPFQLNHNLNKYSNVTSAVIVRKDFKRTPGLEQLHWPYEHVNSSSAYISKAINQAEIVHMHNRTEALAARHSHKLLQYHSPPVNYRPGLSDLSFTDKKLVIAQYHPRFYTDARIVPNIIDIWDDTYMPGPKDKDVVRVFYSWASEGSSKWADKGSRRTKQILAKLKEKYGERVEVVIINNQPHALCMDMKRNAHICIDECVTGSYHLQSLEGCAVGAVTFNNIDEQTWSYMQSICGAEAHPFEQCDIEQLYDRLCYYIEHKELLFAKGQESRLWMEKYWNPKILVNHFSHLYFNLLAHDSVYERPSSYTDPGFILQAEEIARITPVKFDFKPRVRPALSVTKEDISLETPFVPRKGRSIQQLFNRYKGEDIYIFGTGPSLQRIDAEQFKNKICFSVNYAFEKLAAVEFYFLQTLETYYSLRNNIDHSRMLMPEKLVLSADLRASETRMSERLSVDEELAYYYPVADRPDLHSLSHDLHISEHCRFISGSSLSNAAIQAAAYMGAKRIFLIGMDHLHYADGKVHFESKYDAEYHQQTWSAFHRHEADEIWLKKQLIKQSIALHNISCQF